MEKFVGANSLIGNLDFLFNISMSETLCLLTPKVPVPHLNENHIHVHDDYEFTIPISHSPKLSVDNKTFIMPKGSIFPCNPGQYHGPSEILENHLLIAFQINKKHMQNISASLFKKREISFKNSTVYCDSHLQGLLDLFAYESTDKQAGYEFIQENLSMMIGVYLLRVLSNNSLDEKQPSQVKRKEIARVIEFLRANYNNDFTWSEVTDAADISKYHLIRLFKQETGQTPYQYLLDIKIEKARHLIKTQEFSITEVCFMSGFNNLSHFSRLFQQKMGVSPSQYKELCKR